jgi:hypothetical protein
MQLTDLTTSMDAWQASYVGHITFWFGASINNKNMVFHNPFNATLTGADGSTIGRPRECERDRRDERLLDRRLYLRVNSATLTPPPPTGGGTYLGASIRTTVPPFREL